MGHLFQGRSSLALAFAEEAAFRMAQQQLDPAPAIRMAAQIRLERGDPKGALDLIRASQATRTSDPRLVVLEALALARAHGGEPVLMAALLGYGAALLGTLEGVGLTSGPLTIFLPGFLLALVSGAAGQLAPVWLHAGSGTEVLQASQRRLGWYGGPRALLLLSAALLPLMGYKCAGMPGLTALIWFLALFVVWLYRD